MLHRFPAAAAGGGRPGCAASSVGAALGSALALKLRSGCAMAASLDAAAESAALSSALDRTDAAQPCGRRHVRATAEPARAPAGMRTGDSTKGTFATCRARCSVAVRRRGTSEYSHGVLGVLTWGTFQHSPWVAAYWPRGYCEYSHLWYTAVCLCRPPPRPSAAAAVVPAHLQFASAMP